MTKETPRRSLLPHPALSVVLFVMWLLLNDSIAPGTLLMGALLALAVPWFSRRFWPERPIVHDHTTLVRFLPVFLWDVLVANLQVAWLIVNVPRKLHPRWIVVPLDVTDAHAITTLANVISLTPGTVSAEVGPDRKTLLVHCLDAEDGQAVIDFIKRRYEAPIRRIFES